MRHQEFDTREALGKAMQVFWQKGYKGASLQNLLDEMGIGKGSFYATFGSKRELFLQALKHFGDTKSIVHAIADLLRNTPAKETIRRIFDRVIDNGLTKQRVCLFAKTGFEFWQCDPDVAQEVVRGVKSLEDAFREVLLRGQNEGEIPLDRDVTQSARFLTGVFYGLQVIARTNPDRQFLEDIASTALEAIN
ncbi:MAG: TetR/AcrR family transcriptional regulator [Gammaproteobacteria bacterium]